MCWLCNGVAPQFPITSAALPGVGTAPGSYLPNLTAAQGAAAVLSGFSWSGSITYSIPGASATWSGYGAGSEPFHPTYAIFNNTQAQRFRDAMTQWDELIARPLTEVSDATPGQIRVAFTETDTIGSDVWGYANYPSGSWAEGGDIWVDQDYRTSTFAAGSYDFVALLHEIGHALGLKHTFESPNALPTAIDTYRASIMSYTEPQDNYVPVFTVSGNSISADYDAIYFRTPSLYDVAAVQTLYGADAGTRSGDTVYRFDEANAFFQVLYDAGGTDTIDLSGHRRPSALDLRDGRYSSVAHFSIAAQIDAAVAQYGQQWRNFITSVIDSDFIYTWTDNLAIAFGVTIENADLGAGDDWLQGNNAANRLDGGAGRDTILGDVGNDTLDGDLGGDSLYGWLGNDLIYGGVGDDQIFGEQDNDTLWGFDGADSLLGGAGRDDLLGEVGADFLDGQDGDDRLYGWLGNDTLLGGSGADTLFGEADADLAFGWLGADLLWGGDGNDTLWGEQDNDTLLGETGNDVLLGVDGDDLAYGWLGNDSLYGWTGNDVLFGEQGNDLILGEDGADTIVGGLGRDTMTGGAGADRFFSANFEIAAGEVDLITDYDAADIYLFQAGAAIQYFNFNAPGYGVGAGIHVSLPGGVFILDVFGATAAQLQAQTQFF